MQFPPMPAKQALSEEQRATAAYLGLLFVCSTSPRSVEFAQLKLKQLFGLDVDDAALRDAQMRIMSEVTAGLSELRNARRGRQS